MSTKMHQIDIQATNRDALEQQLEAAERRLQEVAKVSGKHGILITRITPGQYTAVLSDQVPFGTTRTHDH